MTEKDKDSITTELEKLHELSMKMEEIVSDLSLKYLFDVDYIKGNIESNTGDIQDRIDEASKTDVDYIELGSENEPSEYSDDEDTETLEVEEWSDFRL